jgi:hypothetical protein
MVCLEQQQQPKARQITPAAAACCIEHSNQPAGHQMQCLSGATQTLWLAVVAAPTANAAQAEGVKVCVHCLLWDLQVPV